MEDNNAIFTKVGSTNARIIRYDELRLDYTILPTQPPAY